MNDEISVVESESIVVHREGAVVHCAQWAIHCGHICYAIIGSTSDNYPAVVIVWQEGSQSRVAFLTREDAVAALELIAEGMVASQGASV
jgi:hypothetical protein